MVLYIVCNMKNDYSFLDTEHGVEPYVLPPIACGWYEHTGPYGDKTVYQFRRMPRAGKYTGRYGLWLKDKDAGMILIGVVKDRLEPEGTTYKGQFDQFFRAALGHGISQSGTGFILVSSPALVLTKRACSWCGRELLDTTRLCHDKPMCRPGGVKKGKPT